MRAAAAMRSIATSTVATCRRIAAAYEYVADSEECYSESTMSSTLEATQQTLSEPTAEEVGALEDESVVLTADVQWCLREDMVEPQSCEVVQAFTPDRAVAHRADERVADRLESPATKNLAASWTFTQMSRTDEETLGELVSERVPSPQNTTELKVCVRLD